MGTNTLSEQEGSENDGRTDLQITVCSNGAINVRNPTYERGHTYSILLDEHGDVEQCSCKGHTHHGHCYHADEVSSRPLITAAANAASSTYKKVASDGGLPEITHHREPEHVGGERYARCEGCGSESIFGVSGMLHDDDCPRNNYDGTGVLR